MFTHNPVTRTHGRRPAGSRTWTNQRGPVLFLRLVFQIALSTPCRRRLYTRRPLHIRQIQKKKAIHCWILIVWFEGERTSKGQPRIMDTIDSGCCCRARCRFGDFSVHDVVVVYIYIGCSLLKWWFLFFQPIFLSGAEMWYRDGCRLVRSLDTAAQLLFVLVQHAEKIPFDFFFFLIDITI